MGDVVISNDLFASFIEELSTRIAAKIRTDKPSKRLLTAKEAGEYIGRSLSGVQHLAELKKVKSGRRVHYDVKDLDRWIEENKE